MATCSSILAWKIPWTEKPGGLQSTGSHRAGHRTEHTGAHSDPRSLMPCSRYSGSEYVSKN